MILTRRGGYSLWECPESHEFVNYPAVLKNNTEHTVYEKCDKPTAISVCLYGALAAW